MTKWSATHRTPGTRTGFMCIASFRKQCASLINVALQNRCRLIVSRNERAQTKDVIFNLITAFQCLADRHENKLYSTRASASTVSVDGQLEHERGSEMDIKRVESAFKINYVNYFQNHDGSRICYIASIPFGWVCLKVIPLLPLLLHRQHRYYHLDWGKIKSLFTPQSKEHTAERERVSEAKKKLWLRHRDILVRMRHTARASIEWKCVYVLTFSNINMLYFSYAACRAFLRATIYLRMFHCLCPPSAQNPILRVSFPWRSYCAGIRVSHPHTHIQNLWSRDFVAMVDQSVAEVETKKRN